MTLSVSSVFAEVKKAASAKAESESAKLAQHFHQVRQHTLTLKQTLSAEDCCVQSMPDASPVKWHLAHTTWFFETFILERFEAGFKPHHPVFRFFIQFLLQRHWRAIYKSATRAFDAAFSG